MITPEVNDVDISKLFNYKKETEVQFGNKKIKVFLRLVGDADLNVARVKALRASNEMRKKLKNEDSDEYVAFLGSKELFDKDTLINLILLYVAKDISKEAINNVDVPFPKEPDEDSSLEDQEKYQESVDNYLQELQSKVDEYVKSRIEKRRSDLNSMSFDELYKIYEKYQIDAICESEMVRVFKEYCVFSGIYADKKYSKRLFSSFEEFTNLPTDIKEKLISEYESIDISSEELKK